MKVILLKSVPKVGKKDDILEVASGYAQHALLPKGLAIAATPAAIAKLTREKQNTTATAAIQHALLDKAIATIASETFVCTVKASEQGNLFSKIGTDDIAQALMETKRISLDPKKMNIVGGPIKHLGTYTVEIVDGQYRASFSVTVDSKK